MLRLRLLRLLHARIFMRLASSHPFQALLLVASMYGPVFFIFKRKHISALTSLFSQFIVLLPALPRLLALLLLRSTEGDANCQTRLANLLYEWTDKATDWSLFLRCDVSSTTLGVDMWNAITLKYQLHSSCDIGVHTDRLAVPRRKDESISSYWYNLQADITHLASSDRRTTITTLADIIKLKTLPVHAT